jgi:predicted metal-dependent hydrolase
MRKWGYCTRDGMLCFNWRLVCLPPQLADYIIYHEALHLRHFNHSPRFKAAIDAIMPDYREREIALRRYLSD